MVWEQQLTELFFHFSRRYKICVVPTPQIKQYLPTVRVEDILKIISLKTSLGDALFIGMIKNCLPLLVFSITTLAVFFGIRPFFLKYLHSPGTKVETNVKALVGKTGLVSGKGNKVVYLPYEATGILSSIGGIKDMLEGTKKGTEK